MTVLQAAGAFGLSCLSLYLAWRMYRANPTHARTWENHRKETEQSAP